MHLKNRVNDRIGYSTTSCFDSFLCRLRDEKARVCDGMPLEGFGTKVTNDSKAISRIVATLPLENGSLVRDCPSISARLSSPHKGRCEFSGERGRYCAEEGGMSQIARLLQALARVGLMERKTTTGRLSLGGLSFSAALRRVRL